MEKQKCANWEKYWILFRLSWMQGLKTYKALIGLSVFVITCLLIFSHLWKLAAVRAGGVNFSPDHLLWYIAFNEWVLVSIPEIQLDIEEDLRTGRLAYHLPRPISYIGTKFAEGAGTLALNLLVLGVVSFVFTWLWSGTIPFTTTGFIISIILGIGASAVALLFHMLVGISAFWLHEVSPFYWIWEKLLFVFGGLILPLTVYPQWMQNLAALTPFPLILGGRSGLAIEFTDAKVIGLFISLFIWAALAWCTLLFLYRRGLSILNIEGG